MRAYEPAFLLRLIFHEFCRAVILPQCPRPRLSTTTGSDILCGLRSRLWRCLRLGLTFRRTRRKTCRLRCKTFWKVTTSTLHLRRLLRSLLHGTSTRESLSWSARTYSPRPGSWWLVLL